MSRCSHCGYNGPRASCSICDGGSRSRACSANACVRCGAYVGEGVSLGRAALIAVCVALVSLFGALLLSVVVRAQNSDAGAGGHPQTLPQAGAGGHDKGAP